MWIRFRTGGSKNEREGILNRADRSDDELAEVEGDLTEDAKRLMSYAEELRQIGVELKTPTEGLVDFPAIVGGELAYLCWKFDEPEIQFWHTTSGGFAGRQPIPREHELTDATSQSLQA